MRIVLTKPAEYPDFVLGPGVVLDLPEQEAEQMVESKAASRFSGALRDLNDPQRNRQNRVGHAEEAPASTDRRALRRSHQKRRES